MGEVINIDTFEIHISDMDGEIDIRRVTVANLLIQASEPS